MGNLNLNSSKAVLGVGVPAIALLVGGYDMSIQILLVLMALDIISGVFKALKNDGFSSKAFRTGLMEKGGFFLVIILAYQLDVMLGYAQGMPIRTATCLFYIGVEGSSLIENLGQIGVPIPKIISEKLSNLNGKTTTAKVSDTSDTKETILKDIK